MSIISFEFKIVVPPGGEGCVVGEGLHGVLHGAFVI